MPYFAVYPENSHSLCFVEKCETPEEALLEYTPYSLATDWIVTPIVNYPDCLDFHKEHEYYSPAMIKKWCELCITFCRNNPELADDAKNGRFENINITAAKDIYKRFFGPFAQSRLNINRRYAIAKTRRRGWTLTSPYGYFFITNATHSMKCSLKRMTGAG